MPAAFTPAWTAAFPGCLPVGYLLREAFEERWLRIHSLPDSTRYADTPDEWRELLHRHRTVADAVLGQGATCWMIRPELALEPHEREISPFAEALTAFDWQTLDLGDSRIDGRQAVLLGVQVPWDVTTLEPVLRAVADDLTGPLLLFSMDTAQAYAPYDGGADLFFRTGQESQEAARRWYPWLAR